MIYSAWMAKHKSGLKTGTGMAQTKVVSLYTYLFVLRTTYIHLTSVRCVGRCILVVFVSLCRIHTSTKIQIIYYAC